MEQKEINEETLPIPDEREPSVSPLVGPMKSISVELTESKTTELDEEQLVCKNSSDLDQIAKPYFNGSTPPNALSTAYDTTSTVALAYSLEIQSRLQHLESLLSAQRVDTDQFLIDNAVNADSESPNAMNTMNGMDSHSANDMMGGIHSNNMKLIEGIIEHILDEKAQSDPVHVDSDRHFYSKLYDAAPSAGSAIQKVNEWSQPLPRKRRPSVEEKAYRFFDRSARALWTDAIRFIEDLEAQSDGKGTDLLSAMTSAVMLYSGGALYFCLEQQATVSIMSFVVGAILIAMVMAIGVLFERSSMTRDWNVFVVAATLSVLMCYIAIFWISPLFNVSSAAILLIALFLSFEYGHGPIAAKERHWDEIWICLLFNCGLPLFSYFMQCPEMTISDWIQTESVMTDTAATMTMMETAEIIEDGNAESVPSIMDTTDTVTVGTTLEVMEEWLLWTMSTLYHLVSVVLSDFWSMLDVTYKLEHDVVNRLQMESQIVSALQQRAQELVNEFGAAATNAIAEAVSRNGVSAVNAMDNTANTAPVHTVSAETADTVQSAASSEAEAMDETLYWFNKLFHLFPAPLFHAVLASWFVTHSTLMVRNVAVYKVESTKILYCTEIALSYAVSAVFWYNEQFDGTLFALMLLTTPWTVGLLKAIWEHDDLQHDDRMSRHVTVYNLWFFMAMFVSICWNWMVQTGLFWTLFSPNALIIAVPFLLFMHSMPLIVDEVVWATDF